MHHIVGIHRSNRPWICVALCPDFHNEARFAQYANDINTRLKGLAANMAIVGHEASMWRLLSGTLDVAAKVATIVASIVVPVVIYELGHDYEVHKDRADALERARKEKADERAAIWARDTDYVHMLANPNDRFFAFAIITQLKRENAFPPDLQPVLDAMAQGKPEDKLTQAAAQLQQTDPAKPVPPGPLKSNTSPVSVFIEYADEAQGCSVYKLVKALDGAGFVTPPAQRMPVEIPDLTGVRYFSQSSAPLAQRIAAIANAQGLHAVVQDYTSQTTVPLQQIELRIGKNDAKANEQFVIQDEKGHPITGESGDALLDESCRPFTIGVSKIG